MKLSTTFALTACAGIAAFLIGSWTRPQTHEVRDAPAASARPSASRSLQRSEVADRSLHQLSTVVPDGISTEQAAQLTSEQRMEMLTSGASVYLTGNQTAVLCGLISSLHKDETRAALKILGDVQDRGNGVNQEVWDTLWKQWGRVDPMGCMPDFGEDAESRIPNDARNVMIGWLETNADAALAWANKPHTAPLEAAAAALAITNNANGDFKQLESAILKLPADGATRQACIKDYFDLASIAGDGQTAAGIYETISDELRPAAWSVAVKQLGFSDPAQAKKWLTEHASDPGRDYAAASDLMRNLVQEDPAATARWAAELPYSPATDGAHPAASAVASWHARDPDAAVEWMKGQPRDAPWIRNLLISRGLQEQ